MKFIARALAWLLAIAVLFAGVFLLVGVFKPRVDYQTEVLVNADRQTVFSVYNDPDRLGEWVEGFRSIENISGEPGQVGSRWRLSFEYEQGGLIADETITAFRQDEFLAFTAESGTITMRSESRFEDSGSATLVRVNTELEGNGPIWKSVAVLSANAIRERDERNLQRLKTLIEEEN